MTAGGVDPSVDELLAAYDTQLRGPSEADGGICSTDGPLLRVEYPSRGFVGYRDLAGLTGAELDGLILRTCAFFEERGQSFEWKTRGHDEPADLADRLLRAGFVAEERETVMIGPAAELAQEPRWPSDVTPRRVHAGRDLDRIAAMKAAVSGGDWSWLADDLADRLVRRPDDVDVYAVEAVDPLDPSAEASVVSAAWAIREPGTSFTGLWGGSTRLRWRRRGLYRALVAVRAQRAVELGYRLLQVDASDASRPILQRLGLRAVTTTTPYVWTPAEHSGGQADTNPVTSPPGTISRSRP